MRVCNVADVAAVIKTKNCIVSSILNKSSTAPVDVGNLPNHVNHLCLLFLRYCL